MRAMDEFRYERLRNRTADPTFVFGVRTTGIACRSGCPSRPPLRRNVVFFDDIAAALAAGFRACKRCAPDDAPDAALRATIAEASALLERPEISLDDVARTLGLSRFHFQRTFREATGVTPGAYRRSLRDKRFRDALAGGAAVTTATYDAGFGSPSRAFDAAPLGMTPSSFRRGADGERIAYAISACSLGRVLAATTPRGICAIELGETDEELVAALGRRFPRATLAHGDGELGERLRRVVDIVDGAPAVELAFDIRGTAFQRSVWTALREIPPGETRTYAQLAERLALPNGARAVAAACANNPLAVAVPCHRVVGSKGALTGYRWGLRRKGALLEREREPKST